MKRILVSLTLVLAGAFAVTAQQKLPKRLDRKPVLLISDWKLELKGQKVRISGGYFNLTSKPVEGIVGQLSCVNSKGMQIVGGEDKYNLPTAAAKNYQVEFFWEVGSNSLQDYRTCTATISVTDNGTLIPQGAFTLQDSSQPDGQ
jgi:hypothetical protein